MNDLRTCIEKEAQDTLQDLLTHMQNPSLSKFAYQELMGRIRTAIQHLENKRFGCASGLHSSDCLCDSGVNKCIRTLKKSVAVVLMGLFFMATPSHAGDIEDRIQQRRQTDALETIADNVQADTLVNSQVALFYEQGFLTGYDKCQTDLSQKYEKSVDEINDIWKKAFDEAERGTR